MLYTLADMELDIEGVKIRVEARVLESLPTSMLLGNDVPELTDLLGGGPLEGPAKQNALVVTCAQARRHAGARGS